MGDKKAEKIEIPKEKKETPKEKKEENPKEEKEEKFLKIKVLEDLPEIVGADMEDYGPFKKDDIVELPIENANLFIESSKAEKA